MKNHPGVCTVKAFQLNSDYWLESCYRSVGRFCIKDLSMDMKPVVSNCFRLVIKLAKIGYV